MVSLTVIDTVPSATLVAVAVVWMRPGTDPGTEYRPPVVIVPLLPPLGDRLQLTTVLDEPFTQAESCFVPDPAWMVSMECGTPTVTPCSATEKEPVAPKLSVAMMSAALAGVAQPL